ncbi:gas vesicle protein [Marinisporobacter balticus]|uniref:Gas vesicle protein GvpA/GvpJ/GvpM family n=1 Tax=Marinisporobacter balticus TaxID=2018667 RepID=A0A4R2L0Q6_9FIRM|nr:gas vesicle protein [Marinisporobacter balticus]TCO77369.1 gas vesicle protein GvpA/GvpJ/GvpM family [Marinisporobacter balticus]
MEPNRRPQATLNDLLDRILDKGILLNTDLIISVSGIPLIGINLKLALAGMETMLEYGIMKDWDEAQRAVAAREIEIKEPQLCEDEYIVFSVLGTHWYSKGIYESWRVGMIYITNKRVIMFRRMPAEVLFETSYEEIKAMALKEMPHYTGVTRKELNILLKEDEVAKLHTKDTVALKEAIENIIGTKGICLEDNSIFPDKKELLGDFLQPEEEITHEGKMWYLMPLVTNQSTNYQWKPGHLYLTNKRLCWWYDFEKRMVCDIPPDKLVHVTVQGGGFGSVLVGEKSLMVLYREERENKAVCFSGEETSLREWEKIIRELTIEQSVGKNIETCPKCGRKASRESLIEKGCSRCGWVSYRIK